MAAFVVRPNKDGTQTVQAKVRIKGMPNAFRSFKSRDVNEGMKMAEEWAKQYEEALLATREAVSRVGLEKLTFVARSRGCAPTALAVQIIEDYLNNE